MNHRIPRNKPFRIHISIFYALVALLLMIGIVVFYFPVYSLIFSYILLIDFVYGMILLSHKISRPEDDTSPRIAFNLDGILVNGHIKYHWENIKSVYFVRRYHKITLEATLNPRFEFIPELTHTMKYGTLEVVMQGQSKPSIELKTTSSVLRFRLLFRKMEKYARKRDSRANFSMPGTPTKEILEA